MPRLVKPSILVIACAFALVASWRGSPAAPGGPPPLAARAALAGSPRRDLGELPILTRALFQVNEAYFDKTRFAPRRMLLGALASLQREVPEVIVEPLPEVNPRQVRVRVGSGEQLFEVGRIDSPWSLRSSLQQILRFVQPRLYPGRAEEEGQRLLAIEIAATNGVLATLDPHSILLDADSYREMRSQTRGRFGGVGMGLIDERRRGIVVRSLIPSTPAARAGILPRDRIVRIDDESTVNMTVADAVDRLRGEVGAGVDIYLERPGERSPRKLTVVREMIRPSSIERERVLTSRAGAGQPAAKIGYFRIEHFSASTASDLLATLGRFRHEKVQGVIMDLRDNPGGLYDQAVKVADAFIDAGTLVSMVGVGGAQRRDEMASPGGWLDLPLAVLVDGRSASASEIVAGAVKNLDRGVVIGDTTFGKGSVQLLFDLPAPGGATAASRPRPAEEATLGLKLTTGQYLTPGDASIQGIGVAPDVALTPLQVDRRDGATTIRLQKSAHRRQEADLEAHLEQLGKSKATPPDQAIAYLHVPPPGLAALPSGDGQDGEDSEDGDAPGGPPPEEVPDLQVLENHVDFAMELARDLLAQTRATSRRQMLAGSAAFFARVRAEQDEQVARALARLGVDWSRGARPGPAADAAILRASLAVVGDGRPVPAGETARIRGAIRNASAVPAHRVRVVCRSANLLLDENEMVFGRIGPGETRTFDLTVKVPGRSATRTDTVAAQVFAEGPIQANTPEVAFDIAGKPRPLFAYRYRIEGGARKGEPARLLVTVENIGPGAALSPEASLRNRPGQPGILITAGQFRWKELAPGATRDLVFTYQVGQAYPRDRYQLELSVGDTLLDESITGRIEIPLVGSGGVASPRPPVHVQPPLLTAQAPTVTGASTVRLTGRVVDDERVRDVYIRVYNREAKLPPRKVFYQPNRGEPAEMAFATEVPVRPGSNVIQVFARESGQVQTVATLVVFRKTPTVASGRLVQGR